MKLTDVVTGIELSKVCSIKAFEGSKDSKAITLKVKFEGVTLADVFTKAVSSAVIQWQNGPGRKQFSNWTDKQTVEVQFKSPGKVTVDPMQAVIALATAANMTVEDYVKEQMVKLQPVAQSVEPTVEPTKDEDEMEDEE